MIEDKEITLEEYYKYHPERLFREVEE